MEIQFRQAPKELAAIERRPVPISHLNITATTLGGAETLFTVRENVALEVKRLSVVNTTGSAATLFLYSVPSGSSAGVGNAEIAGQSIAANTAVDLTDLIGGLYAPETTLVVYSDTSGALTVHGWGEEIL